MRRFLVGVAVAIACAAVVTLVLVRLQRAPAGPVEPAWDRETCAYCRMHVGERAFAAQLQTGDGEVLFFDDPGCLFHWRAEAPGRGGRAWFHHLREERWLAEADSGFVPVERSPMAWGYGAVDAGVGGTISPAEAARAVLGSPGPGAADPSSGSEDERAR